jgi:hypothetical protein
MPAPLLEFGEADWREWLGDGPDPAAAGLAVPLAEWYALPHPVERVCGWVGGEQRTQTMMVGIGDRPHLVTRYRRLDAHRRWTAARRAWLEAHGFGQLAVDWWIDDVSYEHRALRREIRDVSDLARPRRPGDGER